ncbi:MAG: 4Fe-4S binding protein [Candidatus Syntropharchaeia archaeon]
MIEIEKNMEFEGNVFTYELRTDGVEKRILYDYKKCVGCGICVEICPTNCLELGPIPEIATGLDAPPVMWDHDNCSFCGMCVAFCPENAIKMFVSDKNFLDLDEYPHLDSEIRINENCLPCRLCEKVCPKEVIEVSFFFKKKEEIIPFREGRGGKIKVDFEKCNLCGICADFCSAFLLLEKEVLPESIQPFENLLIDENECDYCGLCEYICPENAIHVEGSDEIEEEKIPKIEGVIRIGEDCNRCGWCSQICPYDAIEVKKPFEGEIRIKDINLKKCDPHGCHACINICPSNAWYIPSEGGKIAVEEKFCIFCGACVHSCRFDVMEVKRKEVNHTEVIDSPWKKQWEEAISIIKGKNKKSKRIYFRGAVG